MTCINTHACMHMHRCQVKFNCEILGEQGKMKIEDPMPPLALSETHTPKKRAYLYDTIDISKSMFP